MPVTYPAPPPTVTADGIETISRFLSSPTLIQRAITSITADRFISDSLLTGRTRPSGGAVQFEQTESKYPDQPVESVAAGQEFPLTTLGNGPSKIVAVRKWGIDTIVTDEAIRRLTRTPVDRALIKMGNGVIRQVDVTALAAITAAPIQTLAAAAVWSTAAHPILTEVLTARAMIAEQNEGYMADSLVLSDDAYTALMGNEPIRQAMARETLASPVYTGMLGRLAGLDVMVSPNLPTATSALVLDRGVLGGMADEVPLMASTMRQEETERWRLRAKRITVPFVLEPKAAVEITGVTA